jgi:NADPH:quinone reductase-like Zn-dependent oxidoreductase
MRAITCTGYGRPTDVLAVADVDDPALGDDEVLVEVHAASVNPADWHLVEGTPRLARLQIGLRRPSFDIPGSDVAGVVGAVGPAVTTVAPGDEVYGTTFMAGFGAFAQRVAVPERLLAARPRSASFEEAAAIPLAASTALQALRDHGGVQPGHRVLVVGASGGVGTYAVQLARHLGATVTGVCSTGNLDLVRSLGADDVLDYTAGDYTAGDRAELSTGRFDVILQVAGTETARRLRRLLAPRGTLVQLSGDSPNHWTGPLGRVLAGRLGALASRQTVTSFTVEPNRDDLELLASLYDRGALRTVLGATYDLDDVAGALEHLQTGHARGKVAITVAPATSAPAGDDDEAAGRLG